MEETTRVATQYKMLVRYLTRASEARTLQECFFVLEMSEESYDNRSKRKDGQGTEKQSSKDNCTS